MKTSLGVLGAVLWGAFSAVAQSSVEADNRLSLPDHNGQIVWKTEGFQIVESSAKPNGDEIGLRGRDASGRISFLGFLFLVPGNEPLTSAKCRDGALDPEKRDNPEFKTSRISEITRPDGVPVSLVDYSVPGKGGAPLYRVRGFVAAGNMCGDLEFYSSDAIRSEDPALLRVFQSFQLDIHYKPEFKDVFFYAQVLFRTEQYAAAGPMFEKALGQLKDTKGDTKGLDSKTWRRVATDQAGMSYGISGDVKKARAVFEGAIAKDPDYPLYYYNLACADAEEKNLADARKHLQLAFDRKANTLPGEKMPDPTQDDSFIPYKDDKEFWSFLEGLRARM